MAQTLAYFWRKLWVVKEDKETTGRDDGRSQNLGAKQSEVEGHLMVQFLLINLSKSEGPITPPLPLYVSAALQWNNDEFWETIFFQTNDSDMFFRQKSEQIIGEPRKSMER